MRGCASCGTCGSSSITVLGCDVGEGDAVFGRIGTLLVTARCVTGEGGSVGDPNVMIEYKGNVLSGRRARDTNTGKGPSVLSQRRIRRMAGAKSTWKKLGHHSGHVASITPSQKSLQTVSSTNFVCPTSEIKTNNRVIIIPPTQSSDGDISDCP